MEMHFRKVQQKDGRQLKEICKECFPEKDVFIIVKPLLNSEHFYVIEIQEEVVGFIIFSLNSKKAIHLMILAVRTFYQRKGIGSFLLMKMEQIIKKINVTKIRLEVQIDNKSAINFYEKHGYKIAGTIEKYYDDGSDAYLMIKQIKK